MPRIFLKHIQCQDHSLNKIFYNFLSIEKVRAMVSDLFGGKGRDFKNNNQKNQVSKIIRKQ